MSSITLTNKDPKRRVCLYFGSFNPIHIGHIALATYALESLAFDEVWLMLSPLNPQKAKADQLPLDFRAGLIRSALQTHPNLRLCLYERDLPLPHYTVRTLRSLEMLHPDLSFALLIGGDNLAKISTWFEYETLLSRLPVYVYPRPAYTIASEVEILSSQESRRNIFYCANAPQLDISSSELRRAALIGEDLRQYLPDPSLWDSFAQEIRRRGSGALQDR